MTAPLADWPRQQFQQTPHSAWLLFVVFGEFSEPTQRISRDTYQTAGLPDGISIGRHHRSSAGTLPFCDEAFARPGRVADSALWDRIERANECLIVEGEIPDSRDLNYLRDVVGVVAALSDRGAVAVADPQILKFFSRADWTAQFFEPRPPLPTRHVVILVSDEDDGSKWYHTRGLRKFARPDLSVHGTPPVHEAAIVELFQRFIGLQVGGGWIPDGQDIRMKSLPAGMSCHHRGSLDDPEFNNVHVEISWPQ